MKFGPLGSSTNIQKHNFLPLGIIVIIMMSVLGIILARLTTLTVFRGQELRRRADENRILIRKIPAPRRIIFDRNGKALTRNAPEGRIYPFEKNFTHVIGYVGEVSEDEMQNDSSLNIGDAIGKSGLEKQYDRTLRGVDGAELIEVDAMGNLLGVLEDLPPQSGKDLHTNLDANLQIAMTESLGDRKGAAVAIDPVDGTVLGLASSPAYDPNVFGKIMSNEQKIESNEKEIQNLLTDTINLPLFNRAISGEYPPGSIFKLVTAAAGLAENKINSRTLIMDTGEIKIGAFRFGNWYFDQYGKTEGEIGIIRALARSNDIFFYKVGELLGPDLLSGWARKFGLGEKTEIDLIGEVDGLVPDSKWKEKTTGERWFLGNTYHMAIGQGDVQLTPLQAAMMAGAVATGKKCQPRIANSVFRIQNSELNCQDIGISDQDRNLILEGMVGACSTGGTAFPFFPWNQSIEGLTFNKAIHQSNGISNYPAVACKTGTSQHGGKQIKPHAWIVVVGPIAQRNSEFRIPCPPSAIAEGDCRRENSELYKLDLESKKRIVLVVMLEDAGEGSYEAGPVAKKILEKWFKNDD
ncbi:hypothetical protein HZB78_00470 [Candidatus Collierbacteria bacterium]|nr:hypothetical protein [Candidatus Collierbacteria bacterium]